MLLPCICVADVITTRLVLLPMKFVLADVIAIMVVDVITTVYNVLADGIAKWPHIYMAITSAIFNMIIVSGYNICHN